MTYNADFSDVDFLDRIEELAKTHSRIDPDFKVPYIHLSEYQAWRLYKLANGLVEATWPRLDQWCRTDTVLYRWIPAARQRITDQVAKKLTNTL